MSNDNNFKPNLEGYKPLRPFNLFMKNNFPFIENTFEALDTYGLICQLVKYLNDVIENVQTTDRNIELLSAAFNQLNDYVSHYFDNLDVQEEIDNKLDDMAESGELEEIITTYLNSKAIFTYDNVESLKSATNLVDGSYAKTLGYYEKNDGGSALYKIVESEPSGYYETLDNELYAELIIENSTIFAEQIGCYGDNTHDDSTKLNSLFSMSVEKIVAPKTYLISNTVNISGSNLNIEINQINYTGNAYGLYLKNIISSNIKIHRFLSTTGNGIKVFADESQQNVYNNYYFDYMRVEGICVKIGEEGKIYNNNFYYNTFQTHTNGFYIRTLGNSLNFNNENIIWGGKISSIDSESYPDYAIDIEGVSGYKFYNISLELIKNGFQINNCAGFSLINPRLEEAPRENGKYLIFKGLIKALIISSYSSIPSYIDVTNMNNLSCIKIIGNLTDDGFGVVYNYLAFTILKRQNEIITIYDSRKNECVNIEEYNVYFKDYDMSPSRLDNDNHIKICLSPCNYFICKGGKIHLNKKMFNSLSVNEIFVEVQRKGTIIYADETNNEIIADLSEYDSGIYKLSAYPTSQQYQGSESNWVVENIFSNNSLNKILAYYGSKNIANNTNTTTYNNHGITITPQSDKTNIVNGTSDANVNYVLNATLSLKKGKYKMSGCPSGVTGVALQLISNTDNSIEWDDNGNGVNIETNSDDTYIWRIRITNGAVTSNTSFKPMIRIADWDDNTYAPYAKTNLELSE